MRAGSTAGKLHGSIPRGPARVCGRRLSRDNWLLARCFSRKAAVSKAAFRELRARRQRLGSPPGNQLVAVIVAPGLAAFGKILATVKFSRSLSIPPFFAVLLRSRGLPGLPGRLLARHGPPSGVPVAGQNRPRIVRFSYGAELVHLASCSPRRRRNVPGNGPCRLGRREAQPPALQSVTRVGEKLHVSRRARRFLAIDVASLRFCADT